MMLVGEGALKFAKAYGFKEEDLLTERVPHGVAGLEARACATATGTPTGSRSPTRRPKRGQTRELKRLFPDGERRTDRLGIRGGEQAAHGHHQLHRTEREGRDVGDHDHQRHGVENPRAAWAIRPIIGGGLWLDQDVGGAGSTGRGEENMRVAGAHTCVENMRHGMSPKEAALDALKRVARNFDNDEKRLAAIDLQFYALRKDGEYCGASLWDKRRLSARRGAICGLPRRSGRAISKIRSTFIGTKVNATIARKRTLFRPAAAIRLQ